MTLMNFLAVLFDHARRSAFLMACVMVLAGTGFGTPAFGSTMLQQPVLYASDGSTGDKFGTAMALSDDGNTAIVGAPYHVSTSAHGAAYVYVRSGGVWSLQSELAVYFEYSLGISVSLSGDGNTALVGASNAVHVFKRTGTTWAHQTKIAAPVNSNFGSAISLSTDGTVAIVGADLENINSNTNQGAAYIYKWNGTSWNLQQKLTAPGGALGDNFGHSVAISGDGNTVLISAVQRNLSMGAVYFYRWSGSVWGQMSATMMPTLAAGDRFGESVALSGDGNTAVVGTDGANSSRGLAYVLAWNTSTWQWRMGIQAYDGVANDHFGAAVAISKDAYSILVDAAGRNSGQGAAYLFTGYVPNYAWQQTLTASDGVPGDQPQSPDYPSLALSSDGAIALFGTPLKYANQGAAYVFESQFSVSASGAVCAPWPASGCNWDLSCSPNPVPAHGDVSCTFSRGIFGTSSYISGICYNSHGSPLTNCISGYPKISFSSVSSDIDVQATFATSSIWLFKNNALVQTLSNSTVSSAITTAAAAGDDEIRIVAGGFLEGSGIACASNFGAKVPRLSGGWYSASVRDADPTAVTPMLTISGPCALNIDGLTVE